jgi:hypothetical protein
MVFQIQPFTAQEIAFALKKYQNGEELTDREISALEWEVES